MSESSGKQGEVRHTPGPWARWEEQNSIHAVSESTYNTPGELRGHRGEICEVSRIDEDEEDEDDPFALGPIAAANANLIAAAPDLLAALRPFAELGEDLTSAACHFGLVPVEKCARCSKVLAARAAIDQAEGRTGGAL